jgi:N-acetylglucosamine-6-phosphate deacetylase
MSAGSLLVRDAVLLDTDGVRRGWLRTECHLIVATGTGDTWREQTHSAERVIDAAGATMTPGFIDLHCHGGAGIAFDDNDDISAAVELHRSHGTTRSILSLVSAPAAAQARSLSRIADITHRDPLVLGAHLEGPFLAPGRRGAHDPNTLTTPTADLVRQQVQAARGTLRMVTLAPELPGAAEAQDAFQDAGVIVAVGHTEADYDTARAAFDRGAKVLTHAYNAMPPVMHRAPGPVMAAVDADAVLELILDGVHLHDSVAEGLFRLAPGRVALVTDAMSGTGCGDGDYILGGLKVQMREGIARLAGTDTLAGSTLTQDVALRHAIFKLGVDPVKAVAALTSVPASLLGRYDLGFLRPGIRADLVLLDEDWHPVLVAAEGRILSDVRPAGVGS